MLIPTTNYTNQKLKKIVPRQTKKVIFFFCMPLKYLIKIAFKKYLFAKNYQFLS